MDNLAPGRSDRRRTDRRRVPDYRIPRSTTTRDPQAASALSVDKLRVLTHEIRTPLAAAHGIAELLSHTSLSSAQRKYVCALRDTMDALISLVGTSLDAAVGTGPGRHPDGRPCSVASLVDSVATLFAAELQRGDMSLTIDMDATVADVTVPRPVMARQVLVNLVSNAVRHAGVGEIVIACAPECVAGHADASGVCFEVRDSGPGIPGPLRERIFERSASRGAGRGDGPGDGGMGLSIAHGLVASMGGKISVECPETGGCWVRFTLPLGDDQAGRQPCDTVVDPRRPDAATKKTPSAGGSASSVLLIEDNEATAMVMRSMMERLGHSVIVAATVDDALKACDVHEFDTVVIDWHLPDGGGIAAARRILSLDTQSTNPSRLVLATAADLTRSERSRAYASGFEVLCRKPLSLEKLSSVLEVGTGTDIDAENGMSATPTFDAGIVNELARLEGVSGRSLLATLLDATTAGMPQWIIEIEQAAAVGDVPRVRSLSHDLLGLCRQLGANRMASVCKSLGRLSKAEELSVVPQRLEQLVDEQAVFAAAIQKSASRQTRSPASGLPVRSAAPI